MTAEERRHRLLPNGVPRYVRIYDSHDTARATVERYTVVFTGRYRHMAGGRSLYLTMSSNPYHPQGVGALSESAESVDSYKGSRGRLGKRITWQDLPEACRKLALNTYCDIWRLPKEGS